MAVIVKDTFTDADGTSLTNHIPDISPSGTAWSLVSAGWTINSNQVSGGGYAMYDAGQSDNIAVSVDCIYGSYSAILFRGSDSSNYYRARISSGGIGLFRFINGSYTSLGSYSFTPVAGTTYTIRVELNASNIVIKVNGTERINVTDSDTTLLNNTDHGFYMTTGSDTFDNFEVDSLTSSGTTYTGSGIATGQSNIAATDTLTATASGTAQGESSATSGETMDYAASGQADGISSVTSAETMSYAAKGKVVGISNLSAQDILILVASGTADGFSSLNMLGGTYSGSGTSTGSSEMQSGEILVMSATGSALGVSSLSARGIMRYAAKGTAEGESDVSAQPIVILAASGTATGYSSVVYINGTVIISHEALEGISELYEALDGISELYEALEGVSELYETLEGCIDMPRIETKTLWLDNDKVYEGTAKNQDGTVIDLSGASITYELTGPNTSIKKTVGDGVTITDEANGMYEVWLTHTETASLMSGTRYNYESRLTDAQGRETTLILGSVSVRGTYIAG